MSKKKIKKKTENICQVQKKRSCVSVCALCAHDSCYVYTQKYIIHISNSNKSGNLKKKKNLCRKTGFLFHSVLRAMGGGGGGGGGWQCFYQ